MNEGTRTVDNPLGNGKVRREVVRNEIPHKTLKTCNLLHDHGSLFTLKNPLADYGWKIPKMREILKSCGCVRVALDQCECGLEIPDSTGILGLAKTPASFSEPCRACHTLPENAAEITSMLLCLTE